MRRIIMMGECALDIVFPTTQNNYPLATLSNLKATPGGRVLNAAALLGTLHEGVSYVSEAARDRLGDMIVSYLKANNVNTDSIDRYVDGDTPANLFFPIDDNHLTESIMIYRRYPEECFDVKWPDIDEDDIVVFGSYFAIDPRVRPRLTELLKHMTERKALIVYVPGFLTRQVPRVTRVMPALLENLEISDMVVTRTRDLVKIFEDDVPQRVFDEHIKFYRTSMVNIDAKTRKMTFYHDNMAVPTPISRPPISLMWNAGALAGLVSSLVDLGITRKKLKELDYDSISDIITEANSMADNAVDKARIDHL